ncbi:MAG: hypothetical protein ABIO02_01825 [Patescibacteria group bacterium]
MSELMKTAGDFEPNAVKDALLNPLLTYYEQMFVKMDRTNSSYPYMETEIAALKQVQGYTSRWDFEEYFEGLDKNSQGEPLHSVRQIYESLRFFWKDKGPFNIGALYSAQHALNYPLWNDEWKFTDRVKPVFYNPDAEDINDFYQSIDVGNRVRVRKDVAETFKITKGMNGEVLAFTSGMQAMFNIDYWIISIKDTENWVHQHYMYQLEPDTTDDQSELITM